MGNMLSLIGSEESQCSPFSFSGTPPPWWNRPPTWKSGLWQTRVAVLRLTARTVAEAPDA